MSDNVDIPITAKVLGGIVTAFIALWGFFKTFVTQKDHDKLATRVESLENRANLHERTAVRIEAKVDHMSDQLDKVENSVEWIRNTMIQR